MNTIIERRLHSYGQRKGIFISRLVKYGIDDYHLVVAQVFKGNQEKIIDGERFNSETDAKKRYCDYLKAEEQHIKYNH